MYSDNEVSPTIQVTLRMQRHIQYSVRHWNPLPTGHGTFCSIWDLVRELASHPRVWGPHKFDLGSSRILVVDRALNLHILRTSVQGDLTPPRSNNNTNTTAQTLSSERKHSRGSDDPLTALKKGAVLLRNGDYYYSRPKTQDFQEFCPGPPGSSQNPPFGSSSPHVLGKVVGSSIPQPRATT